MPFRLIAETYVTNFSKRLPLPQIEINYIFEIKIFYKILLKIHQPRAVKNIFKTVLTVHKNACTNDERKLSNFLSISGPS